MIAVLFGVLLSSSIPVTVWSYGQQGDYQGNYGDPTPTPSATATPMSSPTATPAPTATPSPNPLTSGPAADATSADNRYVTVELETEHPEFTARGYQATDLTTNSLIHYSARLATFRGFYTGSNRGGGSNPPSTAPISSAPQLTQAPPAPTPTPTPSPGQKVRKQKTAKSFADEGNDHNQQGQNGN